jgi:N-acetylneuraminate synthase
VGAVLIDCINREYCKKIIIQMPGQRHPNHYHKRKEETFQVLSGIMEAEVEGRQRRLYPGDILVVPQGVWHSFWTETGLVFEEISSTHYADDSYYEDKRINAMQRRERKTLVSQWGRYQI